MKKTELFTRVFVSLIKNNIQQTHLINGFGNQTNIDDQIRRFNLKKYFQLANSQRYCKKSWGG